MSEENSLCSWHRVVNLKEIFKIDWSLDPPRIEKKTISRYTLCDRSPLGDRTLNKKGNDMARTKMSEKTATKKTTVKSTSKKLVTKKTVKKTAGMKEGSKYTCGDCGLTVSVDTACGCAETAHLICCEKPMKMKG
jgi:hypothetical protein